MKRLVLLALIAMLLVLLATPPAAEAGSTLPVPDRPVFYEPIRVLSPTPLVTYRLWGLPLVLL